MIKTFLRAFLKPFSFLPALFMMYMIFSFSSQDGATSGNLSYKVSEIIVESANEAFELQWSGSEIRHYIERIHNFHFNFKMVYFLVMLFPRKFYKKKYCKKVLSVVNLSLSENSYHLQESTHSCKTPPPTITWLSRKSPPGTGTLPGAFRTPSPPPYR